MPYNLYYLDIISPGLIHCLPRVVLVDCLSSSVVFSCTLLLAVSCFYVSFFRNSDLKSSITFCLITNVIKYQ